VLDSNQPTGDDDMQNWETDYLTILQDIQTKPQVIESFQGDPEAFLEQYGTTTGDLIANMLQDETNVLVTNGDCIEKTTPDACVNTHWWGIQLIFNEAATQLAQDGANGVSGLSTAIASTAPSIPGLGAVVGVIAGVIAGAMVVASAAISYVDEGSGIHFNWNWGQLAALTIPGISQVSMATMLIPFSNLSNSKTSGAA
jgi:hypothetical protein